MRTMRDKAGGIEGMPLQLMIMVIVAGLVLAVVLGWTLSIQGPAVIGSVSMDPATVGVGSVPDGLVASRTVAGLKVSSYDGRGQPIPGTVVTMTGAAARTYVAQDADNDGTAVFGSVTVTLPPGVSVGELTLTVQKSGYPSKTVTVPVVRSA